MEAPPTPLAPTVSATNTLDEMRSVLHDATKVFTGAEDIERVKAVRAKLAETEAAHQAEQAQLKAIIRGARFGLPLAVDALTPLR